MTLNFKTRPKIRISQSNTERFPHSILANVEPATSHPCKLHLADSAERESLASFLLFLIVSPVTLRGRFMRSVSRALTLTEFSSHITPLAEDIIFFDALP